MTYETVVDIAKISDYIIEKIDIVMYNSHKIKYKTYRNSLKSICCLVVLICFGFEGRAFASDEVFLSVPMIRKDMSDCSNSDVNGSDASQIGGSVTVTRHSDGSGTVALALSRGTPDTVYRLSLKCVRGLGDVRTDASGSGSNSFRLDASDMHGNIAFDMYPDGAPSGNKFQSVYFGSAGSAYTAMIRQDSSDCANSTVSAGNAAAIGAAVVITHAQNASSSVAVAVTGGTPDTTYLVFLKCVRALGSVRTGGNGTGTASFALDPGESSGLLTFDMYPDGAPSGNKFQSVPLKAKRIEAPDFVQRFAPELRFDRASVGYPMSAQPFYEEIKRAESGTPFKRIENLDKSTLGSGNIPTYYQVRTFGRQVRINYWWFYGYQHACWLDKGEHYGDWEHVMVTLREDRSAIAAVTFYQHNGSYTRIAGPRDAPCTPDGTGRCQGSGGFQTNGSHPVVYPGKYGHGSYHDSNGIGVDGAGNCAYYADYRNPASDADHMSSADKLIDLDGDAEPWIAVDRTAQWQWGPDGISNHPTQKAPLAEVQACEGSPTYALANAGCYKSECLAGDDQASEDCLKECKHGYKNVGLTCNKGVLPWEWSVYGRLTGGNKYSYHYTLPQTDIGLARRRGDDSEWDLP